MNANVWNIIFLFSGFVLSVIAGLIVFIIQRGLDKRRERRPLSQLLNFGRDELLFVFPHREEGSGAILPRTSTEDFMAMNNFISALLKLGWNQHIGVRDPERLSPEDRKHNLVVICSPKSNKFAAECQADFKTLGLKAFYFEEESHVWYISDSDGGVYWSPSWEQEREYKKQGVDPADFASKKFNDFAVITKVANPANNGKKIITLAGIRGFGTWGAGECIKKKWLDIYEQLPEDLQDSDFSALLSIEYDNCDITSIRVLRTLPLSQPAAKAYAAAH